jgi:hypothetical protein
MSYASETSPDLDPAYKQYFEKFYEISDIAPPEGTAEKYSEEFTDDATLIMAGKANKGREGCLAYSQISSETNSCVQRLSP